MPPFINYLKIIPTSSKAGGVAFYGVIGFRALSFCSQQTLLTPTPSGRDPVSDLSMGETAARAPVLACGNAEGENVPPWISPKKRPALKSQTEENATLPGKYYYETTNYYQ